MAIEQSAHYERMSFEAYLALIEQDSEHAYEYLDGRVYMITGGGPDHAIIGSNLNTLLLQTTNAADVVAPRFSVGALRPSEGNTLLQNSLRGRRCIVYNSDAYVQLSEHYRVCPDVTVSRDPRDRGAQDVIRYPSVVAEVLSPATEARDRGQKSLQYRLCPSIQEYLLVSSEFPLVEVFRREKQGFWSLYTLGLHDTIELTSLGLRLAVADVYYNTSFME